MQKALLIAGAALAASGMLWLLWDEGSLQSSAYGHVGNALFPAQPCPETRANVSLNEPGNGPGSRWSPQLTCAGPPPWPGEERIAFLFTGAPRSFHFALMQRMLHVNFFDSLTQGAAFDIFVRLATLDVSAHGGNTFTGVQMSDEEIDCLLHSMPVCNLEFYQPGTDAERKQMAEAYPSIEHRAISVVDPKRYSMWFNRVMVYQMAKRHELASGHNYTWFVHVRFDTFIGNPFPPIATFSPEFIYVNAVWPWGLPDGFGLIPANLSRAFFDLDLLLDPEVFCFGGPGQVKGEEFLIPYNVCTSFDGLKSRGFAEELWPSITKRCCSSVTKGFSEHIHQMRVKAGGLNWRYARTMLHPAMRDKPQRTVSEPRYLNGGARKERRCGETARVQMSWAVDVGVHEAIEEMKRELLARERGGGGRACGNASASAAGLLPHYLPVQVVEILGDEGEIVLDDMLVRWRHAWRPTWACLVQRNASAPELVREPCIGPGDAGKVAFMGEPWMYFIQPVEGRGANHFLLRRPLKERPYNREPLWPEGCVSAAGGVLSVEDCSSSREDQIWRADTVSVQGNCSAALLARAWRVKPPLGYSGDATFILAQHVSFLDKV